MSKATAAKLAVLIFLAFIVCLPEFLPSDTELQIHFHCVPVDSCGVMSWRGPEDGQICEVYENASKTNLLCETEPKKNTTNQNKAVKNWFVCETQADLQSLHYNTSNSELDVDVVLGIRMIDHPLLNVTIHSHLNHSGLHIETHLNFTLVGCCARPRRACTHPDKVTPPLSPPSHTPVTSAELTTKQSPAKTLDSTVHPLCTSNRSHCLFYYEGSNILDTQTKEGRWWAFSTTMWLALVLVLVVLVALSVWFQVSRSRSCFHKQSVRVPVTALQPRRFSKRRVKSLGDLPDILVSVCSAEDEELFVEKTQKDYSREKLQLVYEEIYKRGLSPIHEVSTTDISSEKNDEENRPDDIITEGGSEESVDFPLLLVHTQSLPCLHHRSHPSNKDEEEST
ncbi:hypothetical protein AMEX_G27275 [Astyanax mexicanus]|uniref:Fibronectin type-III domain-containing protein n=1 Tax=Astyanax mexicanus TaxID=7994 RepID=A0A8T2KSF5_ASTMX|nr:hypothetical protein AMEX_G27275 [Astyanax mexicanus]